MHSRKDVNPSDEIVFGVDFETQDEDDPILIEIGTNGTRRSWRKTCAAKRSIERYREQQALKELLDDAFDELDEDLDLDLDYSSSELDDN